MCLVGALGVEYVGNRMVLAVDSAELSQTGHGRRDCRSIEDPKEFLGSELYDINVQSAKSDIEEHDFPVCPGPHPNTDLWIHFQRAHGTG